MTELTADMLPLGGPFRPLEGDSFNFACYPGVSCFNQCCADLNLILTPYDILRLKNRLKMRSEDFLETHVVSNLHREEGFPKVQLKMTENPRRPCPFVKAEGCSVYDDRPGACRTYPLGRGSARGGREAFFLVQEDHCRGFAEARTWSVKDWLADQGLPTYNRYNDLWMEIITSKTSLGDQAYRVKKIQMFFMASYNLDRFRDFVFQSRFLDMFDLAPNLVEQMQQDDEALLGLALDWMKFSLFGEKTMTLKNAR
jgi:hypothetical protein